MLSKLLFLAIASLFLLPQVVQAQQWPDLTRPGASIGGGSKDAAVIVGIGDYWAVSDVPGADSNALAWSSYLHHMRGVPLARMTLLQNNQGTKEEIEDALKKAAKSVKKGGTLWFIFIGHGAASKDGKDGILIGADTKQTASSIYARGVSRKKAMKILSKGKHSHTVIVLDTCFSGRKEGGKAIVAGLQPLIATKAEVVRPKKIALFTAGTGDQFAGPLPGSDKPAFSYLLLGALRGWGDSNGDGKVTEQEARDYAYGSLQFLLKGSRAQTPQLWSHNPGRVLLKSKDLEKGPDIFAMGSASAMSREREGIEKGPAWNPSAVQLRIIEFTSTPPGAAVAVDGKVLCQATPCSRSLAVGEHVVSMSSDCYEEQSQSFAVSKDSASGLSVALKAVPSGIEVHSMKKGGEEVEAQVYVDGHLLGNTPGRFEVGVCSGALEVRKEGYKVWKMKLELQERKMAVFKAGLERLVSEAVVEEVVEVLGSEEGMVVVPAGEFIMGSHEHNEDESNLGSGSMDLDSGELARGMTVSVEGFHIDIYEVTVDEYRECMRAKQCNVPAGDTDDLELYNYGDSERGKHPINGVTWLQAGGFCKWKGKRLPTEAEWEKAARGVSGQAHPWGNQNADCNLTVMDGEGGDGCGENSTWAVGSKPKDKSPYGAFDMGGNLREWVADWYGSEAYEYMTRNNPKGAKNGSERVVRGGSWNGDDGFRSSRRGKERPDNYSYDVGFRCAK